MTTPFHQTSPELENTWRADVGLQRHLQRLMDADTLRDVTPELEAMGALAAGPMLAWARQAETHPPTLTPYDPWGRRIDHIQLSEGWQEIAKIAATSGIIDTPHAARHGWRSRLHHFALLHLFSASSAFVACPLAMTDGAVTALKRYAPEEPWARRAIAHLTSRDPAQAWTSGQWMTEKEGGSDVSRSSTVARRDPDGTWRLTGTKWFTSATTSQCTLTLARPEGAGEGSRALAMFYLEPWGEDGTLNNIHVRRLKDKLGSKALPTAELDLHGAVARPVGELEGGLKKIATVLNIARYYNTNAATSFMARGVQLARAYARVREAFGARLMDLPLHRETLANLQVEYEAALAIGVRLAELLGKVEAGEATELEHATWRLLTPLAKLGTGKQVVALASETLESYGGAGYVEDTGVPVLLRDAQVLPIWEGTTNILSLDALRAMAREGVFAPFMRDLHKRMEGAEGTPADGVAREVRAAAAKLAGFASAMTQRPDEEVQAGARGFALSLYRTYAAALLCEAAIWEHGQGLSPRAAAAARRWSAAGLVHLVEADAARLSETALLTGL